MKMYYVSNVFVGDSKVFSHIYAPEINTNYHLVVKTYSF